MKKEMALAGAQAIADEIRRLSVSLYVNRRISDFHAVLLGASWLSGGKRHSVEVQTCLPDNFFVRHPPAPIEQPLNIPTSKTSGDFLKRRSDAYDAVLAKLGPKVYFQCLSQQDVISRLLGIRATEKKIRAVKVDLQVIIHRPDFWSGSVAATLELDSWIYDDGAITGICKRIDGADPANLGWRDNPLL